MCIDVASSSGVVSFRYHPKVDFHVASARHAGEHHGTVGKMRFRQHITACAMLLVATASCGPRTVSPPTTPTPASGQLAPATDPSGDWEVRWDYSLRDGSSVTEKLNVALPSSGCANEAD